MLSVAWGDFFVGLSPAYGQNPVVPAEAAAGVPPKQTNQTDIPGPAGDEASALARRLQEARNELAAAPTFDSASLTNLPPGITAEQISLRRALLQRLVAIYGKQLGDKAELEAARERKTEALRQAQSWTGFTEPRPYSILLADGLREEAQSLKLQIDTLTSALATLNQSAEWQKQSLAQSEEHIRQANEQLEATKDPTLVARLNWTRDLQRLQSRVAAATAAALDTEILISRERMAETRARLGLVQRKLIIADSGVKFTQTDLDKVVSGLEAERVKLERALAEAEAAQASRAQPLADAREALRRAQPAAGAGTETAPPSAEARRLAELLEVRKTQADTAAAAVEALRLRLGIANIARTMWELRYAVYESSSLEKLQDSDRRLREFTGRVDAWKKHYRQRLDVSSSEVEIQEGRLLHAPAGSDLAVLARERLDSLRERDQVLLAAVRSLDHVERLAARWGESLEQSRRHLPLTAKVRNLFSDAGSFLGNLWRFELLTAEDTIVVDGQSVTGKRSITVGKVLNALLILAIGIWIAGVISRLAEPVAIKRLKIDANQAALIRRWLRVVLVFGLIVFSLVSVKIPLTIFAFAGGALAIGVGFGTQTLLKNFISGIIILFERPFRVGDVLDVAGHRGTVTGIGLRSSVLQLWDNTELLIPNSELLESKLTNWTFSSRTVRFTVAVGVAYGSDARRVLQILAEVADRHGLVQKDPKPQVLFTDFGDSSLAFELRFWVDIMNHNAAQVSSDLRQMIAGAFAEQGIVMAFPQRDVHLDNARPLKVEVVTPDPAANLTLPQATGKPPPSAS